MRIAFLSEHASPLALLGGEDAGGQNVYVDEVSRHLAHLGHAVDVFTRRDAPALEPVVQLAPNVRVVNLEAGPPEKLPKDSLWPLMPRFRDAFLAFAAREHLPYDVLHGNFWMSGWVAAELRDGLGLPAVEIFHAMGLTKRREQGAADTSPPERIAVEQAVIERVDRLIAQCPAERDELVDDYGAPAGKVDVIPSAVNTEVFAPVDRGEARRRLGLPAERPVAVYVGRLLPRKDVRNAVLALGRARSKDAVLVIVGGETREPDPVLTPEISELRQLAADSGVGDRVVFTGKRRADELKWYYGAADVAVTTPWYEPFGLTPLEAQSCGRPVIGSAVGGITFTVADGETGFLVPPRDPDALAEKLDAVFARPVRAAAMGEAARRRVVSRFTWRTVANRTLKLYENVISQYGAKYSLQPAFAQEV